MLYKLRQRAQDEKGFTLIELLVVILIIGILAAIALPSFLNQRGKAQDSEAKSGARTAQTAMETYYTDNQNYTSVKADLVGIESAITDFQDRLTLTADNTTDPKQYSISVASKSDAATVYTITRDATGTHRTCDDRGVGGCKADGTW